MYKFSAVVDQEDNVFVSHCVELGIASQGKSVEEALANLKEACELYLKYAEPDELARLKSNSGKEPILSTITVK